MNFREFNYILLFLALSVIMSCSTTKTIKEENLQDYKNKYTYEDGLKFLEQAIYYHYKMENKIKAINYCLKAKAVFVKYSDAKLAVCLHELGMLYENIGQYSKAIQCNKEGIALDKKLGNLKDLSAKLCNQSLVYSAIGSHKKAMELIKESIKIRKSRNDLLNLCISYFNLASLYLEIEHFQEARDYYNDIIHIMESNPHLQKDSNLNKKSVEAGLFKSYLFNDELQEANKYLQIINDPVHRPLRTGLYYLYTQNYEEAISELKTALSGKFKPYTPKFDSFSKGGTINFSLNFIPNESPTQTYIKGLEETMACNIALGKAYEKTGKLNKALEYYNEVITRAETQRELLSNEQKYFFYEKKLAGFTIIDAYEGAIRVLYNNGKYDEAYITSEMISARLFSEEYARLSKKKNNFEDISGEMLKKERRLNELIEELKKQRLSKDSRGKDYIDGWYARQEQKGRYICYMGSTQGWHQIEECCFRLLFEK